MPLYRNGWEKGQNIPFAFYVALVLSMTVGAMPVLAAGDPLAVINNLSTFIFSLIRAIEIGRAHV